MATETKFRANGLLTDVMLTIVTNKWHHTIHSAIVVLIEFTTAHLD